MKLAITQEPAAITITALTDKDKILLSNGFGLAKDGDSVTLTRRDSKEMMDGDKPMTQQELEKTQVIEYDWSVVFEAHNQPKKKPAKVKTAPKLDKEA